MGGKSGISLPKVKIAAPKITVGKDLGMKSIGQAASNVVKTVGKAGEDIGRGVSKGATATYKNLGDVGSQLVKTVGKGVEGVVANTADLGENLVQGDFKGIGKEALELVQSGKDIAKGLSKTSGTFATGGIGAVGETLGDKNIKTLAANIKREGDKAVDTYGDAAIDVGISAVPGIGQAYALGKTAASGLAKDGISSIASIEGLRDMAVQAGASKLGIDPNLAKMGVAATSGDLKGAALQGLGSYAGLTSDQVKMASTGVSALTGDKKGLASGLASQFGVGEDASKLIGNLAGGNMDFKKMALEKLGSMGGVDPKLIESVASGKIDPMKAFQATGIDPKAMLGDMGSKFGLSSFTQSPEAQEVLEMGRSAGRTVASADAYAKDAQNAAMDMQAKALQTAQGYKIKPGESLGAIAKRMGVSVEELKAANPQIKDINKIAAGANLNIPGGVQRYETPEQTAARKKATDEAAIANQKREPGFLDKAKDFFGGASDAVGSAVDKAKEFAAKNKTGIGLAADVTAATLGYKAGEEGRTAAAGLAKEQLADLQSAGKQFEQMRYDPTRYKQEREFIEQRIAGGGITPQEKLMQQQGDLRAARAGAAARLAGVEQQARMGGRGVAGSALAASLAGGQSVMGEQAATNLQREASASQRLEQDIQRGTNLSRQQTEEEARLAQEQGQFGLTRAQQTGSVRGDLGNLEMGRAGALQNLYSKGADFVKQGLAMAKTQDELNQEKQQREMQAESQRLDLEKKRRDVYGAPTTQTTTPPPVDQAKIDAARRLSQRGQTQVPQTNVPKPATPPAQFNQQNQRPQPGAGQGYGVLAPVSQGIQQGQQAVQKVQSTMDEAKKKADELKKNPLGAFGVKL